MKKKTKEKLRRWRGIYFKTKARYNRGNSLVNDLLNLFQLGVLGGLGIELWNRYLPLRIPIGILPFLVIILIPVFWFLGWIDQEKIHLTQAENEYGSTHLNPVLKKILKIQKEIREIRKYLKNEEKL